MRPHDGQERVCSVHRFFASGPFKGLGACSAGNHCGCQPPLNLARIPNQMLDLRDVSEVLNFEPGIYMLPPPPVTYLLWPL